ncbi:MAG: hypothetical protein EZS28_035742, partial [Streblomastix strix]
FLNLEINEEFLPSIRLILRIVAICGLEDGADGTNIRPHKSIGQAVTATSTPLGIITNIFVAKGENNENNVTVDNKLIELAGDEGVIIKAGVGGDHPQTVFYVTNGSLLIRDITIIGSEDHSNTTLFELYGIERQIQIISCNINSYNAITIQQLPMIKVVVGKSIYISQSHFTGGVFSDTAATEIENRISELIIDQSTFSNNYYDFENKRDGIILDDNLGTKRRIFIKDSQFTGPLDEDDSQMHVQNNNDDNQICNQGSLSIYVTR